MFFGRLWFETNKSFLIKYDVKKGLTLIFIAQFVLSNYSVVIVTLHNADKTYTKYLLLIWYNHKTKSQLRNLKCVFSITVIEEANWLTLTEDIKNLLGGGFDAVICLGNSFAHLLDTYGDQREQR